MPVTHAGTVPAYIESGRILDVDINTYTVSAVTQFTKKPQTGIQFATPYQHYSNGEGIYFMPEVGSLCWICFPSDGQRPFIIGWGPAGDDGDYRSRKQDLNPGDIYLGTRDGNALWLRRGGVVQIGSGPLSQRLYIPLNNVIQDFCENYGLHSVAGDFTWEVQRSENDTSGDRPCTVKLKSKKLANDQKYIAELEIGSHDSNQDTILSLKVYDSGSTGQAVQFDMELSDKGDASVTCLGDVTWKVSGNYSINTNQNYSVEAKQAASMKAGTLATIEGTTGVNITGDTGPVNIQGTPQVNISPMLFVGAAISPVALAVPLLTWLAAHVHTVMVNPVAIPAPPAASPLVTLPPTVPPPPAIASTVNFSS